MKKYSIHLLVASILVCLGVEAQTVIETQKISYHGTENLSGSYGINVSVSGDFMAVGASYYKQWPFTGRVFIYKRNEEENWEFVQFLEDPHGVREGWEFGSTVKIEGENLIIGAKASDYGGEVYFYELNSQGIWEHVGGDNTGNSNDLLGSRYLALSGSYAVAAASGLNRPDNGKAYVYKKNSRKLV